MSEDNNSGFRILFEKNAERVAASFDFSEVIGPAINEIVVDVVRITVQDGTLAVGYDSKDVEPMVRFIDVDSYAEQRLPLLPLLNDLVEYYGREIDAAIDGDPIDYRFARYLRDAVAEFVQIESDSQSA